MTELIYHDPTDRTGQSPFDAAIREITNGEEALIACPYIAPNYLEDIIDQADNWFLLTDVGEWLSIHGRSNREAIQNFLIDHRDQVRHVNNLHAKVVLGNDQALVGSANFTTKGLTGRTEMSVLLDEQETINELTNWFETVWAVYDPPEIDRVNTYIETADDTPSPAQNQSNVSFPSESSPGTASVNPSGSAKEAVDVEQGNSHTDLVDRVAEAPSPEWAYSYLQLAGNLLSETELSNDDPRLLMSLPQAGTLPITVNNRYALVAFREKKSRTEFILPSDAPEAEAYVEQADYAGRFDPIYGEDEAETPWFVGFDGLPQQPVDDTFRELWVQAVKDEMERATASPYKKHHEPVFYKAARNRPYRERVISEAF
uniref:phospholipase D-like domain-containing protein n=1 Tax=Halobacterium sp. (strain GN101) TaxID=88773 RepID=UPI00159EF0BE|nr:phospholipase D-like domain-containing protein [Halobacterium sp. GN101]